VAIRQGQEAGEFARAGRKFNSSRDDELQSPTPYFAHAQEKTDTYAVTDGVTDEQFDAAIESAKEEGNLSRANVVRKVAEISTYRDRQSDKWSTISEMAEQGYHSAQIAKSVGMSEQGLRKGAREKGIEIRADKLLGNSRRIDPLYVIEQIVLSLEVSQSSLDVVTFEDVTPQQASEWLERLTEPLRAIRKMQTELKEIK
jgi:hypothetical protein